MLGEADGVVGPEPAVDDGGRRAISSACLESGGVGVAGRELAGDLEGGEASDVVGRERLEREVLVAVPGLELEIDERGSDLGLAVWCMWCTQLEV
jgi:hypothetical protein